MPGATTSPSASIVASALARSSRATAATRPSRTPTSTRRRGRPVPSTTRPLRTIRSKSLTRSPDRLAEGGLAGAHDEELQPLGPGAEAVGLIGADHRRVVPTHGL